MPKDGSEIDVPPLRPIWKLAKDKAEKAAEKDKGDKAKFAELEKKTFKDDLGPDLDKWLKGWPDFKKITTAKNEIDATIKTYKQAIKSAGMTKKIADELAEALDKIGEALEERLSAANLAIGSDLELGLKESSKKQITPISLFHNVNVAKPVLTLAKRADAKFEIDKIEISIALGDKKVLEAAPSDEKAYSLLANQMYDAADFDRIKKEIAAELDKIADHVTGEKDMAKANSDFDTALQRILGDAADRASKPFIDLAKTKVDRRNYEIKETAKLGVKIVGVTASIVSLATIPFSGGASTVLSIVAILSTARSIGVQIGRLAQEAEQTAADLASDLSVLLKRYQEATKNRVGVEEVLKSGVNAIWEDAMSSITGCKTKKDYFKSKIDGLKVESHSLSDKLDESLKKQESAQKQLREFEKSAKEVLDPADIKRIEKLMKDTEALEKPIASTIDDVIAMVRRVGTNEKTFAVLDKALDKLAQKEPTWAQIGEVVMSVAVSAGFLVGGNVNAPDPYKAFDLVNKITTGIANSEGALQTAVQSVSDVNDLVKEKKKKK